MPLHLLLTVQAIGSAPPDQVSPTVPPPCEAERPANDEIVVCVRRPEGVSPYRINPVSGSEAQLPKAEVRLANGVRASAETEQALVGGFPSNRVMVRLKFKF